MECVDECGDIFDILATQIIDEIGDQNLKKSQVSEWLKVNIPNLNIKLYEHFTEENIAYCLEACAILKKMYIVRYYIKSIQKVLSMAVPQDGSSSILSIKDGASAVTFQNRNEVAKSIKSILDQEENELNNLVSNYQIKSSSPFVIGDASVVNVF